MSIYLWPRQLLNTCLRHMGCMRTIPSMSCTFLDHTPRTCLQQTPSSPRCRSSSSNLSSPQSRRSLLDTVGMSIYFWPRQLLNTFLVHMRCTRILLANAGTFLQRTLCTCLLQAPTSPRCRCSCSKLCSAQVSSSLLGSRCRCQLPIHSCTCLRHTSCMTIH